MRIHHWLHNSLCRSWALPPALALVLLVTAGLAESRAQAVLGSALSAQPLTLEECIQTGLSHQPSIAAARASLASAEAQRQALYNLKLAGLVNHELKIRREQATLGVTVAQGGLIQAQWETIYAVSRNFFSAQYAHKQERLLEKSVNNLKDYLEQTKKQVDLGNPKFSQTQVDKLSLYIGLFESRRIQAQQGVERARAALREAMGLEPGCALLLVETDFPPVGEELCKGDLIALALSRRGEILQTTTAAEVVELEVSAQNANLNLTAQTFAAAGDIHASPVPQGYSNGTYKPSAIGFEMPTTLAGRRPDRVQRARELSARAQSVVAKTRQLIVLETEDAFAKWREAGLKAQNFQQRGGKATTEVVETTKKSWEIGGTSIDELLRAEGLADQFQAEHNESLYDYTLALAALERITAGGYVPLYRRALPPQPAP